MGMDRGGSTMPCYHVEIGGTEYQQCGQPGVYGELGTPDGGETASKSAVGSIVSAMSRPAACINATIWPPELLLRTTPRDR